MGREDVAVCHWQGDVAEVRLHLDSQALTLRGDIRTAIPRSAMQTVALCDEGLCIRTDGGDLVLEFDPVAAGRWQKALLKKPPTLAEKLGVSEDAPVFVLGAFDDQVLSDAIHGAVTHDPAGATLLLSVIQDEAGLKASSDLALDHPDKHLWTVYRKGKAAVVGDAMVRTHMRDAGFIDSKSCAVSDQLTATRYRLRAR